MGYLFILIYMTPIFVGTSDWRYMGEYSTLAACESAATTLGMSLASHKCVPKGIT